MPRFQQVVHKEGHFPTPSNREASPLPAPALGCQAHMTTISTATESQSMPGSEPAIPEALSALSTRAPNYSGPCVSEEQLAVHREKRHALLAQFARRRAI